MWAIYNISKLKTLTNNTKVNYLCDNLTDDGEINNYNAF